MKKIWIALILVISLGTACLAADKVEAPAECKHCGMDRTVFAHSRMVVTYTDGSSSGVCSINCAVTDMKKAGKEVKKFQVADYNSKKLIDAKTATWVLGGDVRGVMTKIAKWAFAQKSDANAFIKIHGGTVATFDEALAAAGKDNAEMEMNMKTHDHKAHEHNM